MLNQGVGLWNVSRNCAKNESSCSDDAGVWSAAKIPASAAAPKPTTTANTAIQSPAIHTSCFICLSFNLPE